MRRRGPMVGESTLRANVVRSFRVAKPTTRRRLFAKTGVQIVGVWGFALGVLPALAVHPCAAASLAPTHPLPARPPVLFRSLLGDKALQGLMRKKGEKRWVAGAALSTHAGPRCSCAGTCVPLRPPSIPIRCPCTRWGHASLLLGVLPTCPLPAAMLQGQPGRHRGGQGL